MPLIPSAPPLTLPPIAPPLPDVNSLSLKGVGLVVVRPFVHRRYVKRAVECDERQLRQVDLMELLEDNLPHARVPCRQFLLEEGIQGRIAVEVKVLSFGWELVARKLDRIVGVIAIAICKLGDVIPAGHSSHRWGCLP